MTVTISGVDDFEYHYPNPGDSIGARLSVYESQPTDSSLRIPETKPLHTVLLTHEAVIKQTVDNFFRYFDSQTHLTFFQGTLYVYARFNAFRGARKVQVATIPLPTLAHATRFKPPSLYVPVHLWYRTGKEVLTAYSFGAYTIDGWFLIGITPTTDGDQQCVIRTFVSINAIHFHEVEVVHNSNCALCVPLPQDSVSRIGRSNDVRVSTYPASGMVSNATHFVIWVVNDMMKASSSLKPTILNLDKYYETALYLQNRISSVTPIQDNTIQSIINSASSVSPIQVDAIHSIVNSTSSVSPIQVSAAQNITFPQTSRRGKGKLIEEMANSDR